MKCRILNPHPSSAVNWTLVETRKLLQRKNSLDDLITLWLSFAFKKASLKSLDHPFTFANYLFFFLHQITLHRHVLARLTKRQRTVGWLCEETFENECRTLHSCRSSKQRVLPTSNTQIITERTGVFVVKSWCVRKQTSEHVWVTNHLSCLQGYWGTAEAWQKKSINGQTEEQQVQDWLKASRPAIGNENGQSERQKWVHVA